MAKFLESAPSNWKHPLVISAVPRDGEPYNDDFNLTVELPISYWSQIYSFKEPIEVKVESYRTEGRILTEIYIKSAANVPCSRCLEPAGVAINGILRYLFSLRPNEFTEETEEGAQDGDEELILLDSWEDEIDLAPLIWEVLITALPSTALCSESCKGLCSRCGANLNIAPCSCEGEKGDPRFEILKSFTKDSQNN